jgi:hypothetical protein
VPPGIRRSRSSRSARKKGKLQGQLAITFTPTGGTANTEVTKITIKKKKRR